MSENPLPDVVLQISAQNDTTKCAWISEDMISTYCVNSQQLKAASGRVRTILGQIAQQYVDGRRTYAPYLPALTVAGAALKRTLFTAKDGVFKHALFDFLQTRPLGTRLRIVSDSSVEVPWNFIYVGSAAGDVEAKLDISDFDDFWHQRFRVRIRFNNVVGTPKDPPRRERVKTLLALHGSRFRDATTLLNALPDLPPKIEKLLKYEVGATMNWADCRYKWESIRDNDSILYIFAHRDAEGSLCLEEKSKFDESKAYLFELTTGDFAETFKKSNERARDSNTLCFVNGCRTAEGEWGDVLLSTTSAAGFQGFIGSEAEVPNDLATAYAVEFLYRLLEEQRTVDQAYDETKVACFPMSLWYSCYAQPAFRIAS